MMDEERLFMKACAGKKGHKTRLSAETYLDTAHHGTEAEIYECPICGFFHIGNPKGAVKKISYKNKAKHESQHKNRHRRFRK